MTNTTDRKPANDNHDPFLHADTALEELYRHRRELLAIAVDLYTFALWKERQQVLNRLDEAISTCLGAL